MSSSAPASAYLLVDGHSVIFGWPELTRLHARRQESAREELVRQLTAYQDRSGTRVVLVFDGRGARVSEQTEEGGIQIFYAPAHTTADAVIERLCAKYGTTHQLTVATSDAMERQTAFSFGADSISVDTLREWLEGDARDFDRKLKKLRKDAREWR